MKIILASGSPRRRELLSQIGIEYEVVVSNADEDTAEVVPAKVVESLSGLKARDVARIIKESTDGDYCVIGADTVVVYDNSIIGKPKSEKDAFDILCKLVGDIHQVYTGVTLCLRQDGIEKEVIFHEKTDVTMFEMSSDQIWKYIATGEPMDKAGAYGIQGAAAAFVSKIDGDYYNVVGLPIGRLHQELCKQNVL